MNSVERIDWGIARDGRPVGRWQLTNKGQQIQVAELGARWLGWQFGQQNLLLGLADVPAIERDTCFIGAVVGRYANRIADSRFTLDGQTYQLPPNEGSKILHGGAGGLWASIWQGAAAEVDGCPAVRFTTSSPAGDQGFPANLELQATYVLGENWVRLDYRANSDARTVINVTNHAYFNLAGGGDVERVFQPGADSATGVGGGGAKSAAERNRTGRQPSASTGNASSPAGTSGT